MAKKDSANYRVTSIVVRANRAYGSFQHIRAEVTVSVLKGGNVKDAREAAIEELHRTIHRTAEVLTSPTPPVFDDDLDYSPVEENPKEDAEPF
jgi:hypothetical protein